MNSNEFSGLSYQQILSYSQELATASSNMQELLNSVKAELNKVGSEGTWSGTAAESVFAEFNKLIEKFPSFNEAVKSCSNYLNRVVENFKSADSAVQQIQL